MHEHGFSVKSVPCCEKLGVFPIIFGEPEEAQANSLCYKVATYVIVVVVLLLFTISLNRQRNRGMPEAD